MRLAEHHFLGFGRKEIQIRHLHFYIEPRQCLCLKESSSRWKSCSLGYQGNHQVKGVDYNKVYANTAKSGSIRILLALTATEGLKTAQLAALIAFLNSNHAETVYTIFPRVYGKKGYRCRLRKTLYDLCQSPMN